jgi:hypothetical protein
MAGFLILTLVGVTTVGAYIVGRRGYGFSRRQLMRAVAVVLDGIGISLIFFIINLLVGAILIIVLRQLMGKFVSIYILQDISLLILSFIQGLVFQKWRVSTLESQDMFFDEEAKYN